MASKCYRLITSISLLLLISTVRAIAVYGYATINLSWKCRFFRCRPQLILTTWCRVFPTRRPDTADVSATSCDVGFFFSVSYVVSLPNCRHVVVVCSLITINHSRYIQNSGTQERNKRFSTLQLLASSVWRHLSCSPFCHVLSGAKSIIYQSWYSCACTPFL